MKTLIGSHLETSGNPSKRFVEKQRIRGRTHLKGGGLMSEFLRREVSGWRGADERRGIRRVACGGEE